MRIESTSLGNPDEGGVFPLRCSSAGGPSVMLVSGIVAAREAAINWFAQHAYRPRQIHSKRVVMVPEAYYEGVRADGLITDRLDRVLSVTVADCLPVFLYHRAGRVFGVVHSGWRGTGIVLTAIDGLLRFPGVDRAGIEALIGPGIGRCCYDVPKERADRFSSRCSSRRKGKYYLDLREANVELLDAAGVGAVRIVTNCTACDSRLGSYRREGPESYTRMIAAIGYNLLE